MIFGNQSENARVSAAWLLSTSWCQYAGIHKQSPFLTSATYRAAFRNRAAEAGSAVSLANGDAKSMLIYEAPAVVYLRSARVNGNQAPGIRYAAN